MSSKDEAQTLGSKAFWGRVGYAGEPFAPSPSTYAGVSLAAVMTVADSGRLDGRGALANLLPLVAAALYESGFASEAGPLSTWSN
jgi:hypothetical protein